MTNSGQQPTEEAPLEYDPFFLHARREAVIIFCIWVVALIWAVPFCYYNGYAIDDPVNIPTTLGIPSWLLWGIAMPWFLADIFTTWFCFWFMKDGDLVHPAHENSKAAPAESQEATS